MVDHKVRKLGENLFLSLSSSSLWSGLSFVACWKSAIDSKNLIWIQLRGVWNPLGMFVISFHFVLEMEKSATWCRRAPATNYVKLGNWGLARSYRNGSPDGNTISSLNRAHKMSGGRKRKKRPIGMRNPFRMLKCENQGKEHSLDHERVFLGEKDHPATNDPH